MGGLDDRRGEGCPRHADAPGGESGECGGSEKRQEGDTADGRERDRPPPTDDVAPDQREGDGDEDEIQLSPEEGDRIGDGHARPPARRRLPRRQAVDAEPEAGEDQRGVQAVGERPPRHGEMERGDGEEQRDGERRPFSERAAQAHEEEHQESQEGHQRDVCETREIRPAEQDGQRPERNRCQAEGTREVLRAERILQVFAEQRGERAGSLLGDARRVAEVTALVGLPSPGRDRMRGDAPHRERE